MSPEYPDQKEIEEARRALEGAKTAAETAAAVARAFALAERIEQARARRLGTAMGGADTAAEILAGVLNRPDPHTWHGDAVRLVLADAERRGDENALAALADDPGWLAWRQNFAGELYEEGRRLVAALGGPDAPRRRPAEAEDGPMGAGLWADLVAAGFLRDLGAKLGGEPEYAAKIADAVARKAATLWAAYQSDPAAPADPIPEWLLDVCAPYPPGPAALMREGGVRNNAAALWRWWTPKPEPDPPPDPPPPPGWYCDWPASPWPPRSPWPPTQSPRPPPGVLLALAAVLWSGKWKALAAKGAADAARLERNPAGLVFPVHRDLGDALVKARWTGRAIVGPDDQQVPLVPVAALDALAGVEALGTLTAHRLVRWMVHAANTGSFLGSDGTGLATLADGVLAERHATGLNLLIQGGLSKVAEIIGAGSKKATGEIRGVLDALAHLRLSWEAPGDRGAGPILTWRENDDTAAAPGRSAVLRIGVGPMLCPGLAPTLPNWSEGRLIVPVLDLPPLDGIHGRSQASAARLDWIAVRELTDRRREAGRLGAVAMDWDRMANKAGLTPKALPVALAAWTTGPAPRWEEVRRGFWMLGDGTPELAAAKAFILEGAARSEKGAEDARRAKRRQLAENGTAPKRKGPPRGTKG